MNGLYQEIPFLKKSLKKGSLKQKKALSILWKNQKKFLSNGEKRGQQKNSYFAGIFNCS